MTSGVGAEFTVALFCSAKWNKNCKIALLCILLLFFLKIGIKCLLAIMTFRVSKVINLYLNICIYVYTISYKSIIITDLCYVSPMDTKIKRKLNFLPHSDFSWKSLHCRSLTVIFILASSTKLTWCKITVLWLKVEWFVACCTFGFY